MKKFRYLLAVFVIALDQLIKAQIRNNMFVGESMPVLKGLFNITYVQNRGAAFNMLTGLDGLLIAVPAAALVFAVYYMERHKDEHWTLTAAICLIIAGGTGNIIDRIFNGFVTDMFGFAFWPSFPVFNLADIAVCVGGGFLVLYAFAFYEKNGASDKAAEERYE